MSMSAHYLAITAGQLDALRALAVRVEELIFDPDAEPRTLDIDKSWEAIPFVLKRASGRSEGGFADLILGAQEVGADLGMGPACYLTQAQVRHVAHELLAFSDERFAAAFSPPELDAAKVYPRIWVRDGQDGLDYLLAHFRHLRAFFADAAAGDQAMLVYLI
mgnify:CR=1 FL=1